MYVQNSELQSLFFEVIRVPGQDIVEHREVYIYPPHRRIFISAYLSRAIQNINAG